MARIVFADAWDAVTEAELTPWYRETVEEDRERLREIDALRNGHQTGRPSASSDGIDRIAALADDGAPPAFPGPDREQLLRLLDGD